MQTENLVSANQFCIHHNVERSFLDALQQSDLIEIISIEEEIFLPAHQISQLEKMVRLHYEMNINLEGIEAVNNLLQQIDTLQTQVVFLNNKLCLYETD
jgi:hypothetical protein